MAMTSWQMVAPQKPLEASRDKNLCTSCGTGYRGNIAADELAKEGFSAVTLEISRMSIRSFTVYCLSFVLPTLILLIIRNILIYTLLYLYILLQV